MHIAKVRKSNNKQLDLASYFASKLGRKILILLNWMWQYCTFCEFHIEETIVPIELRP
jgi:hypothetical protein